MKRHFEKQYCEDCLSVHWMEEVRPYTWRCLGEEYSPIQNDRYHFTRRAGKGFDVIDIQHPATLEWEIAHSEPIPPEYLEPSVYTQEFDNFSDADPSQPQVIRGL